MPRKATSVAEIDQILRVNGLLHEIGTIPSPCLEVITAGGKAILGQLLRAVAGNKQNAKGWSSYGTIELATECGKIEIHYLDIVSMQGAFVGTGEIFAERLQ